MRKKIQAMLKRIVNILVVSIIYLITIPRVADTENLVITTYYPAPYGGYVSLLTTDNTWLARDGGSVGIRTANPRGVFEVNMGFGSNNFFSVNADNNIGLELRSGASSGTPYIDFSNDSSSDFDARLRLIRNGVLALEGASLNVAGRIGTSGFDANAGYPPGWGGGVHTWDVYAEGAVATGMGGGIGWFVNRNGLMWFAGSGSINGICTLRRNDGALAWRSCASGERLMGFAAANFAQEGACGDPAGGSCAFGGLRWVPRDGWMICCRIMF